MNSRAGPLPVVIEPARLAKRISRLAAIHDQADVACQRFGDLRTPRTLRVRIAFARRSVPADPNGDPVDRLLPPRAERPPATRLVSPRGIALRLYLTALFVAQTRPPGTMPGNRMPLADPDAPVSWIDLVATAAERHGYVSARQKKLRQLHEALRRLSGPDVQLVRLPNFQRGRAGRYEGFTLLNEGGTPADGGVNQPYTVPGEETRTLYLPGGLFLNGWIQVLEDSELAFLLMLACLRSLDKPRDFATGEQRLLRYGLGRDAYEAHRVLSRLGLVRVLPGPHPGRRRGKAGRFLTSDPPKLHRFELLNDGFGQPALATARELMTRLAGRPG